MRGWREVRYGRRSTAFTVRLALSGPLVEPLGVTPRKFLEKPFGGPGLRGGQSEGNLSLPLKVPLSAPLPFCASNRSSVVGKMAHVGREGT